MDIMSLAVIVFALLHIIAFVSIMQLRSQVQELTELTVTLSKTPITVNPVVVCEK